MFKKIVKMIVEVRCMKDFDNVFAQIEAGFIDGKLTWNEHELLHELLGKIRMA